MRERLSVQLVDPLDKDEREPLEVTADVRESMLLTPVEPAKKHVEITEVAAPVAGKDIREIVVEGGFRSLHDPALHGTS